MKNLLPFLLIAAAICSGCKKGDKGDTGPMGAQGIPGNANVQGYDITLHSWDWSWNSTYNQWQHAYSLSVNPQSAIYGYVMSGNGKEAMPYYNQINYTTTSFAGNLFASSPNILFEYYNGSNTLPAPSGDTYLYLVVVPPTIRNRNSDIDWNNYYEVNARFNLEH